MDLHIDSHENDLDEIVTALPSEYQKMLEKTQIDGVGNIQLSLVGNYISKDSTMPSLSMNLKVRNGFISNQKSPAPLKNLYIDMSANMPGLKPDSLSVNIDSLYFNIRRWLF